MSSIDYSAMSLAAIALGSNLGDSLALVEAAVQTLSRDPDIVLISQSYWYQTVAVGPVQPDYVNGCVVVKTRRSPESLLQLLLEIEQQFGRERTEHWGPRTLDLDLLLYDAVVLQTPFLILPHPRMAQRAFVLIPLAELVPQWLDPSSGLTILQLRNQVDCSGVSLMTTPSCPSIPPTPHGFRTF
jgi:2-amino-4-hydroxy-6-hydroxymethyldihydropteridine diphosphokinase